MIYLNGRMLPERGAHLSALDRGFTLGDGVFDTLRATGGRVFRLADHLARLERSASAIGLLLPWDAAHLSEALYSILAANGLEEAILRITVTRGVPGERGLMPPRSPSPSLAIQAVPFAGHASREGGEGFTAAVVGIRRNETSPLSRIKSCNYLDSVLARVQAASLGTDEALLMNTAGWMACGASSNLFLVLDGAPVTPSLDCGVLDGVTRRTVLELAGDLGLKCFERPVAPQELAVAEEAFLTNTAIGVMPLVAVDGRPIGRGVGGPVTLRLRSAYAELLEPGG